MKHTAKQTTTKTLADMYRALDRRHPITVTYTKPCGAVTIRTLELYDIRSTQAGAIVIIGMDRQTGESRTLRLDRIDTYTTHRTAYLVPRETPAPRVPVLRSVAAVIACELGRDERPAVTRRHLTTAA
jgi:predicted DNA-binding transcriptional regulator YafY